VSKPERGRIILANFTDPQGREAGPHPAVILTPDDDIEAGDEIVVVVASTKLQYAKPEDMIELPYSPSGHPVTKLKRRCAVICTWLETVREKDIIDYRGKIYGSLLDKILRRVDELDE
jgi:mRNA-degrading endonuclease toxin of MazEF toxin-antitoxin module